MSFSLQKARLANGVRVVTLRMPHLHTAFVSVYVRVGSRHEEAANNGVSHLLEHLFFRGCVGFPNSQRMNARIEGVGGNLNGMTTRDFSNYYTPVTPQGVGLALEVLGDMLSRPLLHSLAVEKRVILEEMLDEVDEDGQDVDLDNLSRQLLFGAHPLGLKIAGTPESVRRLGLREIRAHLARHYVGGNVVVAVSGPVHHDIVLRAAARGFRHLPRGAPPAELPAPTPQGRSRVRFVEQGESQTEFRLCFPIPPETHPDALTLSVLRRVLDDGLSSRLSYNIVERRGLAYAVGASTDAYHDIALFELDGACAPANLAAVLAEALRTLRTLRRGEISAEELRRVKQRYRMQWDFMRDSPADLAAWYAGSELFGLPDDFSERCKQVERLTRRELQRVAERYLCRDNLWAVAVGPRASRAPFRKAVAGHGL